MMVEESKIDPNRPVSNEPEDRHYISVLLDITSRCNLKCRHCFFYRDERAKAKEISIDDFLARIIGRTRSYGFFPSLSVCGAPRIRK